MLKQLRIKNSPLILCAALAFLVSGRIGAQDKFKIAAIGFYNVENLFDTKDSPGTNDADFTPQGLNQWTSERYRSKLKKLDEVIAKMGTEYSPDGIAILGVAEVENRAVLEDLVKQPGLKPRNYQIVHFDSPDPRGIDVALLYQPKYFEVTHTRTIPMGAYSEEGEVRGTRDILYVSGQFDGEPLHLLVNHWPSRRGGEKATQPLRNAAAHLCKKVIDSLIQQNPMAKVLVMGDLNDDPVSPSVKEVLQGKRALEEVARGEMFNPMYQFFKKGIGTLAYRDAWSLFDQIIITEGLARPHEKGYYYYQARIFNPPFMSQSSGPFKGYPLRTFAGNEFLDGYSDHFPVYVYLVRKI